MRIDARDLWRSVRRTAATDWDAAETPAQHLSTLKSRLDLTDEEWAMLLANQAPYLRER